MTVYFRTRFGPFVYVKRLQSRPPTFGHFVYMLFVYLFVLIALVVYGIAQGVRWTWRKLHR